MVNATAEPTVGATSPPVTQGPRRPLWQRPGSKALLALLIATAILLGSGLALLILPASAGSPRRMPPQDAPGVTESSSLGATPFPLAPITITSGGFNPRVVTVNTCTPVQWTNKTTMTQGIVAGAPSRYLYLPLITKGSRGAAMRPADYGPLVRPLSTDWGGLVPANGGTFTRTFPNVGTYPYYLAADPSPTGMVMVMNLTNFSIEVSSPSKMVSRGGHVTYIVRVVDRGLQPNGVTLTVSDAQDGTSFSWGANPVTPTGEAVLTVVAASEAPLGGHNLTIAGDDGCLRRSVTTTLYVVKTPVSSLYLPVVRNVAWAGSPSQWRFGFAHVGGGQVTDYAVAQVRAGWYYDVAMRLNPPRPAGLEYMQTVRVRTPPSCTELEP